VGHGVPPGRTGLAGRCGRNFLDTPERRPDDEGSSTVGPLLTGA
jgi:hypothetical protein